MKYYSLDIETNHSDVSVAIPLQIALREVNERNFKPTCNFYSVRVKYDPPPDISPWSRDNLPPYLLDNEGILLTDAIQGMFRFVDQLRCGDPDPATLIGHNILAFDIPILRRHVSHQQWSQFFHYRVRDTSVLCNSLADAGLLEHGRLGDYLNQFNITQWVAHDASDDARCEAELYSSLVTKLNHMEQRIEDEFGPSRLEEWSETSKKRFGCFRYGEF